MDSTTLVGYIAAFCTTVSFLPQALQTIKSKNTEGISLTMYSIFTFGTIMWLIFGLLSHSYPIIFANIITIALSLVILVYKIRYK